MNACWQVWCSVLVGKLESRNAKVLSISLDVIGRLGFQWALFVVLRNQEGLAWPRMASLGPLAAMWQTCL